MADKKEISGGDAFMMAIGITGIVVGAAVAVAAVGQTAFNRYAGKSADDCKDRVEVSGTGNTVTIRAPKECTVKLAP